MGRSPPLVTLIVPFARPWLISMSPLATLISPGIMASDDGVVDGDELGAVGESRLDLDLGDHFGDALHDVGAREERGAEAHQLGDALAVARALEERRGDEGDRLGVVELEAARLAPLGDERGGEDQQLVLLPRRELHALSVTCARCAARPPRAPSSERAAASTAW